MLYSPVIPARLATVLDRFSAGSSGSVSLKASQHDIQPVPFTHDDQFQSLIYLPEYGHWLGFLVCRRDPVRIVFRFLGVSENPLPVIFAS